MRNTALVALSLLALATAAAAQNSTADARVRAIVKDVSAERIEHELTRLVAFGTRHSLSDTVSTTRGIGAARRWIKSELDQISRECGGCLQVRFQEKDWPADGNRLPRSVRMVNVLATLRGTEQPDHYLIMTAHLDSRASDANDSLSDAPGAADDGSGVAAVLEAARVLSRAGPFRKTIVLAALSGEEQGLYGGRQLAELARDSGWVVEGVFNNDIVGNRAGMDGERNDREFRVFSEPVPATETEAERLARRSRGGEIDGPSRQLARYVDRVTERYIRAADAIMIYRLDRFGRGGDHRAFNDLGFPGIRFTVMHEDYNRQHQNIRSENGIEYGDVLEEVSFPYIGKIAAANAASLALLAWAPVPPDSVRVSGAVTPNTTLRWSSPAATSLAGFRIYWRETTEPQWSYHHDVGDIREFTLENVNIDNYFFGVASIGKDGSESAVVFAK